MRQGEGGKIWTITSLECKKVAPLRNNQGKKGGWEGRGSAQSEIAICLSFTRKIVATDLTGWPQCLCPAGVLRLGSLAQEAACSKHMAQGAKCAQGAHKCPDLMSPNPKSAAS